MVRIMNNKKVMIITILVILGMIVGPTIYKVHKRYNEELIRVVESEFVYQAKKCYYAGDCKNKKVFLKDLYDTKYMTEKLTNPINKKYYADKSYVNVETLKVKLIS